MSALIATLAWAWAVVLPPVLGAAIARAVLGRSAPRLLIAAAGVGLGHGLTSALFFLCLLIGGGASPPLIVALELSVLAAAAWAIARRGSADGCWSITRGPLESADRWGLRGAAFVVAACVAHLVIAFALSPHGGWDAWAIWNLKARFLARDGFEDLFAPELWSSHPDYPLLLSSSVARAWVILRGESILVPMAVAAGFWAALVAFLFSGLLLLRGTTSAAVGVAVLLSASSLTTHTASQVADIPVASLLLGSLVLAAAGIRSSPSTSWRPLALAGAHAGLTAWTKNEGALMVLALALVAIVSVRWWRAEFDRRTCMGAVAGALAPLLVVAAFKLQSPATNDVLAAQDMVTSWERLSDGGRWCTIALDLAARSVTFGDWPWPTPLLLCAAVLLSRVDRTELPLSVAGAVALVLIGSGFFFVYLLTPYDLEWHLDSSANRLILQLWPATVFLSLLALAGARSPRSRVLCVLAATLAACLAIGDRATTRQLPRVAAFRIEQPLLEVAPHLAARGRVGILTGEREGSIEHAAVLFGAQYTLAPRLLVAGDTERVLVVMPNATSPAEDRFDVVIRGAAGVRVLRRREPR